MTPRHQFLATVADNIPLCREHFRLVLRLRDFPPTQPGQFIQIACRDVPFDPVEDIEFDEESLWRRAEHRPELREPVALLRRPFSLAGRRDTRDGVELDIIHRVIGVGTEWMSKLQIGDKVDILGPLGNRFELPRDDQLAILVGGGVGIPPMLYLAEALKGRRAVAFSGAVSRDLLPLTIRDDSNSSDPPHPGMIIDEFALHDIPSIVSTDDGSFGFRGFVTRALERWIVNAPSPCIIYTCGPEPMMKRVADIAMQRGIECQVAVERAMACGMGTCQSCCIRVRKPDPAKVPLPGSEWCWRLACTDGPIFRGAELLW